MADALQIAVKLEERLANLHLECIASYPTPVLLIGLVSFTVEPDQKIGIHGRKIKLENSFLD